MKNSSKEDCYTTKDVAAHFGVTPKRARRAMRAEGVRCGSGSRHRFTKDKYEEVIRKVEPRLTTSQAVLKATPEPDSKEAAMTNEETQSNLKDNIKKRSTWLRGLYMLLFMIICSLAGLLVFTIIIFQFLSMALSGKTNSRLREFGKDLSAFVYEILLFLIYNREDKPFPFNDWPRHADSVTAAGDVS